VLSRVSKTPLLLNSLVLTVKVEIGLGLEAFTLS